MKMGNKGDRLAQLLLPNLIPLLLKHKIKVYRYETDKDKQKQGMDGKITMEDIEYEIKTRDRKYYNPHYIDFCIETVSVYQNNQIIKKGWFYTSKADFLIYLWYSDSIQTKFIDGYIIKLKELRETLDKIQEQYWGDEKAAQNYGYETISRMVPLTLIKDCCIPIKRDYNEFLAHFFV